MTTQLGGRVETSLATATVTRLRADQPALPFLDVEISTDPNALAGLMREAYDVVRADQPALPALEVETFHQGQRRAAAYTRREHLGAPPVLGFALRKWSATSLAGAMLHEAAHVLNWIENVDGCTGANYHNRKFADAAERLGLTVSNRFTSRYGELRTYRYGFSNTQLGTDAHDRWSDLLRITALAVTFTEGSA